MSGRTPRRRVLPAAACVALVAASAACTSDGSEDGATGPTAAGEPSPAASAAEDVTQELLGGDPAPDPLASVRGSLTGPNGRVDVTADVLGVEASPSGARLRWRLRSTGRDVVKVKGFSLAAPPQFDTRAVSLEDTEGDQVLLPYIYQRTGTDLAARTSCLCSSIPDSVGADGEELDALFPPLGQGTTTVDVVIPGFETAAGVEVTRS